MIQFGVEDEKMTTAPQVLSIIDDTATGRMCGTLKVSLALTYTGEPGADFAPTGLPELDEILKRSRPVYTDTERVYTITFPDYIVYQVRCESFTIRDDYEVMRGRFFAIYEKSRLLDNVEKITIAQKTPDGRYYPGEWTHYAINAEKHIIDVITASEPEIAESKFDPRFVR